MKYLLCFLYFMFLPFQLSAQIKTVSLSQYPIRVSGDNPQLCHTTALLCDEYIGFLKDTFGKQSFTQLKYPLSIHLMSSPDTASTYFKTPKTLIIQTQAQNWEHTLTNQIGIYCLNALYLETLSLKDRPIPIFIPNGLSELYWQRKSTPQSLKAYFSLSEGICIPYDIILSAVKPFEAQLAPLFDVQSLLIMHYFTALNSPAEHIKKYISKFHVDPNSAKDYFLELSGFTSLEQLRKTIFNRAADNSLTFRLAASLDTSSSKTMEDFLHGILTFSFLNPQEKHQNSIFTIDNPSPERIIVQAAQLKLYDVPYIAQSQIEGKIIILKILQESCEGTWHKRITNYIAAFSSLKQGNFEQYYDYLYQASK